MEKAIASAELTEADVMRAIARNVKAAGLADIRDLCGENGNLKPVHELSDEAAMLVAGFEVVQRRLMPGTRETDTVIKVKLRDHAKFVELGARALKMLTEKATTRWIGTISRRGWPRQGKSADGTIHS